MDKQYFIYILTNFNDTVLYIGVTNDLERRFYEHKKEIAESFTQKYKLNKLVYYEITQDINSAIAREKQLKNWHMEWKLNLIKSKNPNLLDLSQNNFMFPVLGKDPETSSG